MQIHEGLISSAAVFPWSGYLEAHGIFMGLFKPLLTGHITPVMVSLTGRMSTTPITSRVIGPVISSC